MERPKRRKSSDNPYELISVDNKQIIKFKDSRGNIQEVEVNEQIFNAFDKFELEDIKELNEYDRHIEHSDLLDETLYKRSAIKDTPLSNVKTSCKMEFD